VRELQGQPCIDLDDAPGPKKQIACTRSFCQVIEVADEVGPLLEKEIYVYAARVALSA